MSPLLALADEVPNFDAIALSPGVGWLLFAALVCLALFFLAHRDSWRRFWLRLDDPRPLGAMRIAFGLCALCNVNGLWELFEYLFTDEGLFPTDIAQHYRARSQFAGFGDGTAETDPWGFFSFGAFVEWLKGPNWSLLLFNSSPRFFWTYLVVFEVVMVLFIIGFQTRWTKWLAWFLFMGIILRNTLFWEATENVYKVFFFYLCLSRCGEAYSVDNWLRCRRLRREGRLSEPGGRGGGAGAPAEGELPALEPIYRAIPAWPRMLVVLNVAALYCATGVLKNGPVWRRGDAMYYAFNLDHFYRLPPQDLSALFGDTLFRLSTWITHWWEALFPLLVLGLLLRWHRREGIERLRGLRLWQARIGLGGFVAAFYLLVLYSYPVHFETTPEGFAVFGGLIEFAPDKALRGVQTMVAVGAPLLAVLVVAVYRWLRRRADTPWSERGKLGGFDLEWVCRWLLGRRIWLVLGLIFHGHLILTMNIGWFSPGLLTCYLAFLNGDELGALFARFAAWAHRWLKIPMPAHLRAGERVPSMDRSLAQLRHRDGHLLGVPELLTCLGLAIVAVIRRVQTDADMWAALGKLTSKAKVNLPEGLLAQTPEIQSNWFVAMIAALALVAIARRRQGFMFHPAFAPVIVALAWFGSVLAEREAVAMSWVVGAVAALAFVACRRGPKDEAPSPAGPWAYGPLGRVVAMVVIIYHLCAVATTQFPEKDSWSTFRRDAKASFTDWLRTTHTNQGWGMFAPNPPRRNVFLRVTVTDQSGEVYDLNNDVYACFLPDATEETCRAVYPIPWIWYTRQRKMNRRIAGSEGGTGAWYQKWHARYVCRRWELDHGELLEKVELYKITYPIRPPEEARGNPYDPKTQYHRKGSHRRIHTTRCGDSVEARMRNEVRLRHGLEPLPADALRPWNKHRCRKWETKLIDEARARGEQVDPLDPRFDVCPDQPAEVRAAE